MARRRVSSSACGRVHEGSPVPEQRWHDRHRGRRSSSGPASRARASPSTSLGRGARVLVLERAAVAAGRDRPLVGLRADALRPRARRAARRGVVPVLPRLGRRRRRRRLRLRPDGVRAARAARRRRPRSARTWRCSSASASTPASSGRPSSQRLVPGIVTDDVGVVAYEPDSGYADPSGTAAGFIAAARARGARLDPGLPRGRRDHRRRPGHGRRHESGRVRGADRRRRRRCVGAALAATVGLSVPVEPWRHDTAFFGAARRVGRPTSRSSSTTPDRSTSGRRAAT